MPNIQKNELKYAHLPHATHVAYIFRMHGTHVHWCQPRHKNGLHIKHDGCLRFGKPIILFQLWRQLSYSHQTRSQCSETLPLCCKQLIHHHNRLPQRITGAHLLCDTALFEPQSTRKYPRRNNARDRCIIKAKTGFVCDTRFAEMTARCMSTSITLICITFVLVSRHGHFNAHIQQPLFHDTLIYYM